MNPAQCYNCESLVPDVRFDDAFRARCRHVNVDPDGVVQQVPQSAADDEDMRDAAMVPSPCMVCLLDFAEDEPQLQWPRCNHCAHAECLVRFLRSRARPNQLQAGQLLPADDALASMVCPCRGSVLAGIGIEGCTEQWGLPIPASLSAVRRDALLTRAAHNGITVEALEATDVVAAVEASIHQEAAASHAPVRFQPMPQPSRTQVVCCVGPGGNDFSVARWVSSCPQLRDDNGVPQRGADGHALPGPPVNEWSCLTCGTSRRGSEVLSHPSHWSVSWPQCPNCNRDVLWIARLDGAWQGGYCESCGRSETVPAERAEGGAHRPALEATNVVNLPSPDAPMDVDAPAVGATDGAAAVSPLASLSSIANGEIMNATPEAIEVAAELLDLAARIGHVPTNAVVPRALSQHRWSAFNVPLIWGAASNLMSCPVLDVLASVAAALPIGTFGDGLPGDQALRVAWATLRERLRSWGVHSEADLVRFLRGRRFRVGGPGRYFTAGAQELILNDLAALHGFYVASVLHLSRLHQGPALQTSLSQGSVAVPPVQGRPEASRPGLYCAPPHRARVQANPSIGSTVSPPPTPGSGLEPVRFTRFVDLSRDQFVAKLHQLIAEHVFDHIGHPIIRLEGTTAWGVWLRLNNWNGARSRRASLRCGVLYHVANRTLTFHGGADDCRRQLLPIFAGWTYSSIVDCPSMQPPSNGNPEVLDEDFSDEDDDRGVADEPAEVRAAVRASPLRTGRHAASSPDVESLTREVVDLRREFGDLSRLLIRVLGTGERVSQAPEVSGSSHVQERRQRSTQQPPMGNAVSSLEGLEPDMPRVQAQPQRSPQRQPEGQGRRRRRSGVDARHRNSPGESLGSISLPTETQAPVAGMPQRLAPWLLPPRSPRARQCRRRGCVGTSTLTCSTGHCDDHCRDRQCSHHQQVSDAGRPPERSSRGSVGEARSGQCLREGCSSRVQNDCRTGYCQVHCRSPRCQCCQGGSQSRRQPGFNQMRSDLRAELDRLPADLVQRLPQSVREGLNQLGQRTHDARQGEGQPCRR